MTGAPNSLPGSSTSVPPNSTGVSTTSAGAVGATYQLNAKNLFKLHLGNSFRFPTAIELSSNGVHHGNFRHERGDPDLVMERGYQADLTYILRSNDLSLEISAFYAYYTDYIYLSPTGNFSPLASGGTLWQYRQDDALFNGFEVAGRYLLPIGLQVDLAVDFVQNLNLDSRLPLPLTPPPSVQLELEYAVPSILTPLRDGYLFAMGRYNFAPEQHRSERTDYPRQFYPERGPWFYGEGVRPGRPVKAKREQPVEHALFQPYQ